MDREEGEMSDDNIMEVDDTLDNVVETKANHTMLYKAEKGGVVVQKLEKIDALKLEERAKRFGIELTGTRIVTQKQIDELYKNFGIKSGNERHFRFDTLHVTGIDGLSIREIFEYLEDYKPISLEQVDETSCNIVCQDHISAAMALLIHSKEINNDDIKKMISHESSYHWREGMPHPKKEYIFMRFATNGDKKVVKKKSESKTSEDDHNHCMNSVSKNPWGDLCRSWGVYDHQEIFARKLPNNEYEDDIEQPSDVVKIKNTKLAMRLGKRRKNRSDSDECNSDSEWKKKSKTPRMRMHADDEESKLKKTFEEPILTVDKSAYAPLSIEVLNSESGQKPKVLSKLSDKLKFHNKSKNNLQRDGIHSRLGAKITPREDYASSDGYSSEGSEPNIMSRVQRVNISSRTSTSVWSRLEQKADSTNNGKKGDLRHMLSEKNKPGVDDLRKRLGTSKQSNLRIEIDNNYASD